jgi:hypothetical protein
VVRAEASADTGMNRNNPISLANRDTMFSGQSMYLCTVAALPWI